MRICHVSPHLPPDQAANALLPAELGGWLRSAGHDVSFVTQAPSQGKTADDSTLPGPVVRIAGRGTPSALARLTRLHTLRRAREITAALERAATGAELLHLHSNGLIIEVAAAWAQRRRVPYVLTLYGTEIWHYKPRKIFDPFTRAYQRATEVTFYSETLLGTARLLGLDRAGLSVVYPAVSAAFSPVDEATRARWRAELGIAEPRVILNVKRLHELANQDVLIHAFARIARSRRDVRLVICGTGALRGALEQQTRDLGVADRVTFAGLVPNAEVARYAAVADVFALPSRLEALPTVAVEALAAGTPVVSGDHPGGVELHEIFGDDVLVVRRGQVDQLATALEEAVATPVRTRPETADHLQALFSPRAVRQRYEAVYSRCLKRTIS